MTLQDTQAAPDASPSAMQATLYTKFGIELDVLNLSTKRGSLQVQELELTCLPRPDLLLACYSDLLAHTRGNQESLQHALVESLQTVVRQLSSDRNLGTPDTAGHFRLQESHVVMQDATMRVLLRGRLELSP